MTTQTDDPLATQFIQANQPDTNATLMAQPLTCPVCGADNSTLDIYCRDCGFLLAEEPVLSEEAELKQSGRRLVSLDGLREFPLRIGENTVGREDSDVLLADASVSRKQAVISVSEDRTSIKDLGSTNGTKAGGSRLAADEERRLRSGDQVVFGTVTLRYESDVEEAEPAEEEGTQESEAPEEMTAPPARLVSADGALAFDLKPGVNSIGRRDDVNTIALPDPFCSGKHAQITGQNGDYTVVDLGSTNGSLVNGVKLEPGNVRTLISGDELTLGKTTLKFEVSGNE
jgi:pSer/pThr/pTyr-binding forkhead associated (FHA) protein